jgi:hypothetical protein
MKAKTPRATPQRPAMTMKEKWEDPEQFNRPLEPVFTGEEGDPTENFGNRGCYRVAPVFYD